MDDLARRPPAPEPARAGARAPSASADGARSAPAHAAWGTAGGRRPRSDLTAPQTAPRDAGQARERNALLRALSPGDYGSLLPHLDSVDLVTGDALWAPDGPIPGVHFPRTAVCSLLTPLADARPVESATVGCEGLVGIPVVLGAPTSHTTALTRIGGAAAWVAAERFRAWLPTADGALPLFLRYAQVLLDQTAQSVACNRRHTMDERCARWLLATRDRVGGDTFPLTHEFLAAMLGARRASVTIAAGALQQAGLIRYKRGRVTILDHERLQGAGCDCYAVVRDRHARLLGTSSASA